MKKCELMSMLDKLEIPDDAEIGVEIFDEADPDSSTVVPIRNVTEQGIVVVF